jgi:hypothetical protein
MYQLLAVDGKYKKNAGPYPMPEESSTHSNACLYKIHFSIISSYVVGSLNFIFSLQSRIKILYAFIFPLML